MAYQRIVIKGNIGQAPETRTVGDTSVTNFSVAVGEKWKDKQGNTKEHTEWFRCSAWGQRGEVIAQYCGKGDGILIEGKMRSDKYNDKNTGEEKVSTQLIVDNFDFVGGQSRQPAQKQQPVAGSMPDDAGGFEPDADIPF